MPDVKVGPKVDVIILGAGAAGLFCAAEAARRGRRVVVLDHAKKIGEKIRISGGGRCNFTNIYTAPENFLSQNPKYCISALRRFTPRDFLNRITAHNIAWHEKTLGQLFCDNSATQIIDMLMNECHGADAIVKSDCVIHAVTRQGAGFRLETNQGAMEATNLVVATGGKSIPKIGATGFGYELAAQFGLNLVETRAGLVPLTFDGSLLDMARGLSGVSLEAQVSVGKAGFREGFLFTHRGLSGPSILQVSNYWREDQAIVINLMPDTDAAQLLLSAKRDQGHLTLMQVLNAHLPKRLAAALAAHHRWSVSGTTTKLAEWGSKKLDSVATLLNSWPVTPTGSEGYRTAEVTLGGVDTRDLDSRTMQSKSVPGLYFIGEVVDVTGWLGGYNFQWAWSSGYVAGQSI